MDIEKTEKSMYFANFNITYGKEENPMLTYFDKIIFPAFLCQKHRDGNTGCFWFDRVAIKEIEGEYVLVGNLIKSTEYNIRTVVKNGMLLNEKSTVPTAPYSRFLIFLLNHRMVLVKNESNSPSIGSFRAQCQYVIGEYIKEKNKELKKEDKFPRANVNILNMPLRSNVSAEIEKFFKINKVTFNFFPLNNDIPTSGLFQAVTGKREELGCKTSNLTFNSPKNKEELAEMITENAAITKVTVAGTDSHGNKSTIKGDKISGERKISIIGEVSSDDDIKIVKCSKNIEEMAKVSIENNNTYKKFKNIIRELIKE